MRDGPSLDAWMPPASVPSSLSPRLRDATSIRCVHLETIDSTQLHTRRQIDARAVGDHPVAFIAREQTGGVGRLGRRWWSPPGGLWLTVVIPSPTFRTDIGAAARSGFSAHGVGSSTLSLRVGLCVAEACERACSAAPSSRAMLKWPNDVLIRDRKVAGILIERLTSDARSFTLMGIGVNVNNAADTLPPDVRDSSGSLRDSAQRALPLEPFQHALLASIEAGLGLSATASTPPDDAHIVSQIRQRQWGVGRTVAITLPDGSRTPGEIVGLTDDGSLIAKINGETRTIRSAELG